MAVYVLHIDPPYKHARHYIGYTPGHSAMRRIGEHMDGRGSPLIRAALAAGCRIIIAHVFHHGGSRIFERSLKQRADTRRWCPCCGINSRPLPTPARMTNRFLASKPNYPVIADQQERADVGF